MGEINIGMYDIIVIKCLNCGKMTSSQTKIIGNNDMTTYCVGHKIPNKKFANCILELKNKCGCRSGNAIVIKNGKIIGVENPKYASCREGYFGSVYWEDKLTQIVKEKLKKIENDNKKS